MVGLNSGNLRNARDTLFHAFQLIGNITGQSGRADSLINFIEQEIRTLDSLTEAKPIQYRLSAYIGGISFRGAHGISSTEAFYAPFRFVNVENVAGNLKEKEPVQPTGTYVDLEQIIQWDPDFLFIDAAGLQQARPELEEGTPLAQTLTAVKQRNVYALMPHNWYATNFVNVLANAWFVGKVMHPQAFRNIDAEGKARRLYRVMVGRDVYDQMKSIYDGWEQL